jgi:hypothetical protein
MKDGMGWAWKREWGVAWRGVAFVSVENRVRVHCTRHLCLALRAGHNSPSTRHQAALALQYQYLLYCTVLYYTIYIYVYTYLYMFIYTYIHLYTFIYIYIHLYTFTYIYIHLYMFINLYDAILPTVRYPR